MGDRMAEFDLRAQGYKDALARYPNARQMDREAVLEWLQPKAHEVIVDLASGNGYIAQAVAPHCKQMYLADPSAGQLGNAPDSLLKTAVPIVIGETRIPLGDASVDAIYSFGGFHHMRDHYAMLRECHRILRPGGRLLICDVLEGSALARHFDARVALHCVTGHHRAWLNSTYLDSLLARTGFHKPMRAEVVPLEWVFDRPEDIGKFLKGFHGMECSAEEVTKGVREHLGINRKADWYGVPWPMLFALTRR